MAAHVSEYVGNVSLRVNAVQLAIQRGTRSPGQCRPTLHLAILDLERKEIFDAHDF